jgi:hypothetical protein
MRSQVVRVGRTVNGEECRIPTWDIDENGQPTSEKRSGQMFTHDLQTWCRLIQPAEPTPNAV